MRIGGTEGGNMKRELSIALVAVAALGLWSCGDDEAQVTDGREIFRNDTFGDERQWTDVLHMNEVIETAVDPVTALSVGLKVDSEVLPPGLLASADLKNPATTVALIKLNAVVGIKGTVVTEGGRDRLTRVGITCALCHSTVDDSVMPGIGRRLDGWANTTLNPGAIIALSPALTPQQKAVYNSWGPGRYDPRFNIDGRSTPVVIPPAYGLRNAPSATYTGDGDVRYWNNYVAVTQMGGQGSFVDERIGVSRTLPDGTPDLVGPKLNALRDYQLSLAAPAPPAGSFDSTAAQRGRAVFDGAGRCASCHQGEVHTQEALHAPGEVGTDGTYATRTATKRYRSTPLRALWQHPPYFHDGSARTLDAVVDHYIALFGLNLTPGQRSDLVEYLKSI
ncbi:MAG TPA: c-type cytochrome [Vicinamibacteria bacterium]|nr:c-type cytochrome [Vicinamibacteria bacterium]